MSFVKNILKRSRKDKDKNRSESEEDIMRRSGRRSSFSNLVSNVYETIIKKPKKKNKDNDDDDARYVHDISSTIKPIPKRTNVASSVVPELNINVNMQKKTEHIEIIEVTTQTPLPQPNQNYESQGNQYTQTDQNTQLGLSQSHEYSQIIQDIQPQRPPEPVQFIPVQNVEPNNFYNTVEDPQVRNQNRAQDFKKLIRKSRAFDMRRQSRHDYDSDTTTATTVDDIRLSNMRRDDSPYYNVATDQANIRFHNAESVIFPGLEMINCTLADMFESSGYKCLICHKRTVDQVSLCDNRHHFCAQCLQNRWILSKPVWIVPKLCPFCHEPCMKIRLSITLIDKPEPYYLLFTYNKRVTSTRLSRIPTSKHPDYCGLCRNQLKYPVNITCGHKFCVLCLFEFINEQRDNLNPPYHCPSCRDYKPILRINDEFTDEEKRKGQRFLYQIQQYHRKLLNITNQMDTKMRRSDIDTHKEFEQRNQRDDQLKSTIRPSNENREEDKRKEFKKELDKALSRKKSLAKKGTSPRQNTSTTLQRKDSVRTSSMQSSIKTEIPREQQHLTIQQKQDNYKVERKDEKRLSVAPAQSSILTDDDGYKVKMQNIIKTKSSTLPRQDYFNKNKVITVDTSPVMSKEDFKKQLEEVINDQEKKKKNLSRDATKNQEKEKSRSSQSISPVYKERPISLLGDSDCTVKKRKRDHKDSTMEMLSPYTSELDSSVSTPPIEFELTSISSLPSPASPSVVQQSRILSLDDPLANKCEGFCDLSKNNVLSVRLSCGHKLCAKCFEDYWRKGYRYSNHVICPICNAGIRFILPLFSLNEIDPQDSVAALIYKKIKYFNCNLTPLGEFDFSKVREYENENDLHKRGQEEERLFRRSIHAECPKCNTELNFKVILNCGHENCGNCIILSDDSKCLRCKQRFKSLMFSKITKEVRHDAYYYKNKAIIEEINRNLARTERHL